MQELSEQKKKLVLSLTDSASLYRGTSYINDLVLYPYIFNELPIVIEEVNIDCKRASKWFSDAYSEEIKDSYFNKILYSNNKETEIDDLIYVLENNLMVKFDTQQNKVRFLYKSSDPKTIEIMVGKVRKYKKEKESSHIHLIVHTKYGFETKSLSLQKPNLKLNDNYNDDFSEVNEIIMKRLTTENDKGLVLLHGKPGTGKTSFIRYLATTVNKNIIFLPPNLASAITNPELITLLIDNPNSIFVIEDAEQIISARESNENSPVSALLNLADGLLSDCLNIQIICSFNTDISKVDNALLRKGRLIAKYEFRELEPAKANALSEKLGFKTQFEKPVPLTEIYNQTEKEFGGIKKKKIGF
ncbi:MAG: AAA family ATPase [Candidatus Delongbacteria bacterium]|nr:AAA family ATPase [Candidatus Delongbacteria bacterium]